MYHKDGAHMISLKAVEVLRKKRRMSERVLAESSGVSRGTLRSILSSEKNVTVQNIEKVSEALGSRPAFSLVSVAEVGSDDSIAVVSLLMSQDEKWTIHLFNFVDAFRRLKDPRLVELPPVKQTPLKYRALLASTVAHLCFELGVVTPTWAEKTIFLEEPWFISGVERLRAMALLESPVYFRRNNIFVLENFLARA